MRVDNAKLEDGFWLLRSKQSGHYATAYNFSIDNAPNGNDNQMLVAFCDYTRHDAEISADRHIGDIWEKDWELVYVKFLCVPEPEELTLED